MKTPSRRDEINPNIIKEVGVNYKKVIKLKAARKNESLEGTGSLVLDNRLRKIYCCLSERAGKNTLDQFHSKMSAHGKQDYKLESFNAYDKEGVQIYHTNVMLAMLDKHAICCLDSVKNTKEKAQLKKSLKEGGREIIDISYREMGEMCGNMIQLRNANGGLFVIMSERARKGLTKKHL